VLRSLFAFLCLLGGTAAAAEPPFPRPDLKEWTLDNGLQVAYLGVHKAPVVTVQVWYHVGSKDEQRDLTGSAHMFEHMMFKGTRNVHPEMHARFVSSVGGIANAFTREDVTGYHQTLPRQYLDFVLQLEAERMRGLLIRKEMVDVEREVVKEELRMRIESSPIARALERFRRLAYTRHPYAWLAAGSKEDLDRLTPADLQKFYDRYYQPNNALLIVVGDVSEEEVRAGAEKHFGKIPRAPEPPRSAAVEPAQEKPRRETAEPAQLGVIIGGYHIPPARSEDLYPLRVLSAILSGGESSRLHQRVVRRDRTGVYAAGQLMVLEDPGLFVLLGAFLAAEQGEKVEAAMVDEIARVSREKVTDQELVKARNQLTAGFVFSLEDVDGIAEQIGSSKLVVGDARAWIDDYQKLAAVTAEDVQRVAREYLRPEKLTLVVVPPRAQGGGK
jgi:zinc protease